MQEEIWKDIDGFPYQVSSLGNIKSLARYVEYFHSSGKLCRRYVPEKVLKFTLGTSGYPTTHIYTEDGIRSTVMIHRLVAMYHLDSVEGKDFVNHKDGDKENNNVCNLEWVTKSENTLHALDNNLLFKRGEDCNLSKLNESQVIEILSLRKFGKREYLAKDIAERYGISTGYVSDLAESPDKWGKLKESLTEEKLYAVFLDITKDWKPTGIQRKPSKHHLTDEEVSEILNRRRNGERVVDIAKDFNKSQKFISWFTRKHLYE